MAEFLVHAWALADFSGAFGSVTNTTGGGLNNTSTTLDSGATPFNFFITDDDAALDDAYVEPGAPSAVLSTLTNDTVIDGVTYAAGSSIEAEFTVTTTDVPPITFVIGRIGTGSGNSGTNLVVFSMSPINPGQTFTIANGSAADGPHIAYDTICYARGTMVDTNHGPIPVEMLAMGDEVITRDSGTAAIKWIGSRKLSGFELLKNPHLCPIRIKRNALGANRPSADLVVSPQHRVLVDDWRASYLFGEDEVLVPAKSLVDGRNIVTDDLLTGVEYFHILLENHELLAANGQWAESLFPGEEAIEMLTDQQRIEIETVCPEFFDLESNDYQIARPTVSHQIATTLAA